MLCSSFAILPQIFLRASFEHFSAKRKLLPPPFFYEAGSSKGPYCSCKEAPAYQICLPSSLCSFLGRAGRESFTLDSLGFAAQVRKVPGCCSCSSPSLSCTHDVNVFLEIQRTKCFCYLNSLSVLQGHSSKHRALQRPEELLGLEVFLV